jgi:hypothetical protein
MRRLATAFALLLLLIAPQSAPAQTAAKKETVEELVKALSEAFTSKSLGGLAAARPQQGRVRIVVEHSITGTFDGRNFKTLEAGERWLKSREREDGPARQVLPLKRCRRGVCTYDFDGGILHNNLYLQKVAYGYRNGRPYIKTIYLLDGD